MSEIKPALTAEEWAEVRRDPEIGKMMVAEAWDIEGDPAHARAALLLDRMPFGFTREHLYLLQRLAGLGNTFRNAPDEQVIIAKHEGERGRLGAYHTLTVGDLRAAGPLADTIAALLPPEE